MIIRPVQPTDREWLRCAQLWGRGEELPHIDAYLPQCGGKNWGRTLRVYRGQSPELCGRGHDIPGRLH